MEQPPHKSLAPSWQPLAYALILILGVYIGINTGGSDGSGFERLSPRNALDGVLDRVEQMYVDPVVREELEKLHWRLFWRNWIHIASSFLLRSLPQWLNRWKATLKELAWSLSFNATR